MAITNVGQLTTPEQFGIYYFEQLKTELESADLSISKVGLVGLLLHIMGNLQYDTKRYYDGLFKEAFPVSSTNDSNLAQHAILFNYTNKLAQAAQINGTLEFDFLNLPQKLNGVVKRELILKDIVFYVGDLIFNILSNNKLIIDMVDVNAHYRIETIDKLNIQTIQPISIQYPQVDLINCEQVEFETLTYEIPNYPYYTYYQIEIELTDLFISNLFISVQEYNSSIYVNYDTNQNKTFQSATDNIVFYSIFVRNGINILLLELGSGKHGKYIPNSSILVKIAKTKGILGNVGTQTISNGFKGSIQLTDYDSSGNVMHSLSNLIDPNSFLKVNIIEAIYGRNPATGNVLRQNLIEFVQSRNNLINELDFRNILAKYFKYYDFIFKKLNFQDNIIGLYVTFLNRLLQPEYTTTANILTSQFRTNIINDKYILAPVTTINGEVFVSPFLYMYDPLLCFYKAFLTFPDITFNPTNITKSNGVITQQDPLIQLKLIFDDVNINTKIEFIKVVNYSDTNITYLLTIPDLNIFNAVITPDGNSVYSYTYNSIIVDPILVYIYIVNTNNDRLFEFKFDNIGLITDFGDFLHLKTYTKTFTDSTQANYVIDVPLIHQANYENDKLFYLTRIKTQLGSLKLNETRLISDDIQLKFLNTFNLPREYTTQLTVQSYDIDIKFPLIITIDLILQKLYVTTNDVDVSTEITNLHLEVSKYLDSLIGTQFKFYKTVLIDICQVKPWVKHVNVVMKDFNGVVIPDYNIEIIPQKDITNILNFTPTLFWIDVNQLAITYKYLGD